MLNIGKICRKKATIRHLSHFPSYTCSKTMRGFQHQSIESKLSDIVK
ncbi:hypothetical protein BSIN_0004 [Burkholderia singularis]|uniref:Uncharacterized protein n=1 Tax=Burkholderia singularis TaxID=1503053 RepID=A0A238H253_9BURK|nr:hypothetical protein BSIN_0004 [Burkholderia singularis]